MAHQSDDVVEVAETFAEVARALSAHLDLRSTLDKIVHLAVEHLEACEHAGISLVEERTITSPASSSEIPRVVDRIQSETDQGPCIDAIKEHTVFETGDLREEDRWPEFSQRAYEEAGIVSVLSLRLFVGESTLGALNLYSSAEHAFDETDVALGSIFAVHAAVAMQAAHHDESLEQKVRSRDVIGQAKGILMARSGVSEDRAFEMLKTASQRMNVKLRDVAEHIASGRSLAGPGDPIS